ncbi:helix-turn-helix protein [Saccharothrix saharensis]|uniref:Helix-turn-helix protein n=1 Tax=Saccharothrix saharensis TaxID=571190 RepID=A0A543J5Q8_9PSEU|nr:helix-turn-helix protein [Saccharothrix saharensis]
MGSAQTRELGEELRRLRQRRGHSTADLARYLGYSEAWLSKIESGTRRASPWEIDVLLGFCDADLATRDRINRLVDEPVTGHFLRPHPGRAPDELTVLAVHEAVASTITCYERSAVPALVQTEGYARAALAHCQDVEQAVRRRLERWQRLRFRTSCTALFFVHESMLSDASDDEIPRDQAATLASLVTDTPNVRVRLVPTTTDPLLRHDFTVMTFEAPVEPLAYSQTQHATVFAEGDHARAYRSALDRLDQVALDPDQSVRTLYRLADTRTRSRRPD